MALFIFLTAVAIVVILEITIFVPAVRRCR